MSEEFTKVKMVAPLDATLRGENEQRDPKYGGPRGAKRGIVDTAPAQYFPRYHYTMLTTGLTPGKHTLRIRVLDKKHESSTGKRVLIGNFLIGGTP